MEFELRPAPPAVMVSVPPPPAPAAAPPSGGHARPARGLNLGPAAPVPVSHDDFSVVVPTVGVPDGDEDGTFDSASPSTLRGGPGAGDGSGIGSAPSPA